MKLRYTTLSALALALTGSVTAQLAAPRAAMMEFGSAAEQATPRLPMVADAQRGGGPIFSEDFANGLAGNNNFGAWTVEGPNGNIWKRAVNGPNGAYTVATQRIVSTTVANGYMLFASDSANSDWSVTPPVIVAAPVNWEGSLVSPLLDLSATPYVEIEFQQRLRYCCQDAPNFLEVSTDGGVTWPNSYSTATGIDGNADPGTQVRKINLTAAIAADPTMVKFRFRHNSEGGSSHYHWQLDDIKIQELAPFDLRMTDAGNTAWDFNTALTYDSIRYSVFPYSQLRPLGLNMTVLNNGSETQDDVVANFTIMEGANEILNQDQAVSSFPPGETRTIFVDPGFTPPAVEGTYDVSYSITSGAVDPTADNTGSSSFQVSEFLYGRDGGTYAGFEDGNGDGGTLILGNAMYIANDVDLYSVAVALGNSSEIGALVVGELRNVDADFSVIATSQEVIVEQSMLNGTGGNKFTQLIFDNPQSLAAGSDYLVTVQVFGNVRIGTSGTSEAQTSYIYYISPTQGENWFFTTTTPMVRMNFNPTVGIEDADRSNGIGLGQNFPNPATGTTTIPYELESAAKVSFQVRDLSGKLVMEQYEGTRAAGNYRLVLDTNTLPEGLYSYTISAGDVRLTKRMTVIH